MARAALSETALSRGIREALAAKGARVFRIQSGIVRLQHGKRSYFVHCAPAGTPDLLVIFRGVYTWLEVKTPRGKLSADQRAWHAWAEKSGVRVVVVRSISEALRAVFASSAQGVAILSRSLAI